MRKFLWLVFTVLLWAMMMTARPRPGEEALYAALALCPIIGAFFSALVCAAGSRLAQVYRLAAQGRWHSAHSPERVLRTRLLPVEADYQDTVAATFGSRGSRQSSVQIVLQASPQRTHRHQPRPAHQLGRHPRRRQSLLLGHPPFEGRSDDPRFQNWEAWLRHCERLSQAGPGRSDP
jgi:hypothetical protein